MRANQKERGHLLVAHVASPAVVAVERLPRRVLAQRLLKRDRARYVQRKVAVRFFPRRASSAPDEGRNQTSFELNRGYSVLEASERRGEHLMRREAIRSQ